MAIYERLRRMPELLKSVHPTGPGHFGVGDRGIIALVNPERLRRILTKMLDENEFLSPYGIRSLSKFHEQHSYVFQVGGQEYRVDYLPAESNTGMFCGNSNWRGPIWMPVNALIIRALVNFYLYYGDDFKIECPTGSGKLMNLFGYSCWTSMAGDPSMAARESSRAIPSGATTSTSLNTSMATMVPGSAPVTKPAGPDSLPNSSGFTASSTPSGCWKQADKPRSLIKPEPLARKITALVLGWVEDWVVRSDSRGFGVAEASWKCGVASIVW